jgi:hypothetical protein
MSGEIVEFPGREPPGVERDRLVRLAWQAETGARMSEWLSSPGLQTPT